MPDGRALTQWPGSHDPGRSSVSSFLSLRADALLVHLPQPRLLPEEEAAAVATLPAVDALPMTDAALEDDDGWLRFCAYRALVYIAKGSFDHFADWMYGPLAERDDAVALVADHLAIDPPLPPAPVTLLIECADRGGDTEDTAESLLRVLYGQVLLSDGNRDNAPLAITHLKAASLV